MASVSSLGIGSGLDLNGILQKLVEAERGPATQRLDLKEAETQASISAFGSLKGSLSEFQTNLKELTDLTEFQNRSVSVSDSDIFEATADSTASVGTTSINVLNLAEAHKLVTADFATPDTVVGTGTLKIEAGGSSFDVDISDGTLSSIRDAINDSAAKDKVSASVITVDDGAGGTVSKLVVTSKVTGTSGAVELTVIDDDGVHDDATGLSQLHFVAGDANNRLTELTAATDGRITVDGFTVSSSTNVFKDAINGVTITALKKSADPINDPPETLDIKLNTTAVKGKVASFVTTYNGLRETFNQLLSFNVGTGESGLLNGDVTVRTAKAQIERVLFDTLGDAAGAFNNLAQLGITTGENGKLSLDSEALDRAIAQNFDDIGNFFAGDKGLAKKVDTLVSGFLGTNGIISVREKGFDTELQDVAKDRQDLAARLTIIEARTRQQFAGLDSLISKLNSTGSFLTEQLKNTSAIITGLNNKN